MVFNNFFSSDSAFDSIYSLRAQQLSSMHWTPLNIAKTAAEYLTNAQGSTILDIGSGVGKFCITAAHYFPNHIFYGVEQRKILIDEAIIAQKATGVSNVKFIHGNFTDLDMTLFDHFYFYNSFSENIVHNTPIDNIIQTSEELYEHYLEMFIDTLENKPLGTKVAAFHCPDNYFPPSYKRIANSCKEPLTLWIKKQ